MKAHIIRRTSQNQSVQAITDAADTNADIAAAIRAAGDLAAAMAATPLIDTEVEPTAEACGATTDANIVADAAVDKLQTAVTTVTSLLILFQQSVVDNQSSYSKGDTLAKVKLVESHLFQLESLML